MNKTKYLVVILLLIFQNIRIINAQSIGSFLPSVVKQTANSATINKFLDNKVSKYTGVPEITIPIYNISLRDYSLPISLYYNSSGIKVGEESGLVGLGWSIDLGGQISHEVRGNDDFSGNYFIPSAPSFEDRIPYPSYQSFYDINTFKICTPISAPINLKGPSHSLFSPISYRGASCLDETTNFSNYMSHSLQQYNYTEFEPDVYHLKVGKFSTSFALKRNGLAVEKNPSGAKIEHFKDSRGKITWKVTDRDGNRYFFDKNERTGVEPQYTNPFSFDSSWFVTKIETAKNDVIEFLYEQKDTTSIRDFTGLNEVENSSGNGSVEISRLANKHLNTHLLVGIKFPGGLLEIWHGNRLDVQFERRIDSIKLYNWRNAQYYDTKSFTFNYDYFSSNFAGRAPLNSGVNPDWIDKRLKLESMSIGSQRYSFKYNEAVLPRKDQYARDHWGYFNGKSNNETFIGKERIKLLQFGGPLYINMPGADREPDSLYNQCFILNKIVYPTGGSVQYLYETNDYDLLKSIVNDFSKTLLPIDQYQNRWTHLGGGLRIKTILSKNHDQDLHPVRMDYVYNYLENIKSPFTQRDTVVKRSFGILPSRPSYCSFSYSPVNNSSSLRNRYSSTVTDINLSRNIGYSKVEEYQTGGQTRLHKSEYLYYNIPDIVYDHSYWKIPGVKHGESNFNGLLLKTIRYKKSGTNDDIYSKIHVSENEYKFVRRNEIWAMKYISGGYAPSTYPGDVAEFFYPAIFSDDFNVVKVSDTVFNKNGLIATEVTTGYKSSNFRYVDYIETVTSKSEVLRTSFKYPIDFSSTPVYTDMTSRNILSPIVEEKKTLNGKQIGFVKNNYFSPFSNIFVPQTIERQVGTGENLNKTNFSAYDIKGNALNVSDEYANSTSYIWAYNGTLPIAEIKNVSYNQVVAKLGEAQIAAFSLTSPDKAAIDKFLAPLFGMADAEITSYSYIPLVGIGSTTDINGKSTYYEYDTDQRLKYIRDHNMNIIKAFCYNYLGQVSNCN